MKNCEYIIITDIGSTTTKGILLKKTGQSFTLEMLANSATTVEKPYEDVGIGLYNTIKLIENKSGILLTEPESTDGKVIFKENVCYLTTSSAGGGLQILVVGLSLNESASSAERAAYGAGGVILDTIAINDNRSTIEQIRLISLLKPDIILFSGGVDGGAYASVIRLSEILKASNPTPKFSFETKIPLIYAGNKEARDFIANVFEDKFDLHFTDNIRPTMKEEHIEPARDEIHRIFMDKVMEQAPGYPKLKNLVTDVIVPTPSGVIKSLELFTEMTKKTIIAFDIGGATTDVFSNIFGKYYRTVSANYGMSYSIANVMTETGYDNIKKWLPKEIEDNYIRNYIANKMLYPTYLPQNDLQTLIEHSVAKEAVRMSFQQHLRMNFNTKRIGYFDRIKEDSCQFYDAMYYEKSVSDNRFFLKDFDIVVAAGGIITGTKDKKTVAAMISDSLDIDGVTEIWYDNYFLSPHLGKLSDLYPEQAKYLLLNSGYKKLLLLVKPLMKNVRKKTHLMRVNVHNEDTQYDIFNDDLVYIENKSTSKITFNCIRKCNLGNKEKILNLSCDVPILIDTRKNNRFDYDFMQKALNLYQISSNEQSLESCFSDFTLKKQIKSGASVIKRSLPYQGTLNVKVGDEVKYDTLLGEVKFEPPRLYIINIMTKMEISKDDFIEGLLIKEGDTIQDGQKIFGCSQKGLFGSSISFESPVRGIVEKINNETGSIYMRELQDYPLKPVTINIAAKMGIKTKHIRSVIKKKTGDYIRTGEILAKKIDKEAIQKGVQLFLKSPATGTITNIDTKEGTVTIQYLKEPINLYAGMSGQVVDINDNMSVDLKYEGVTITTVIGFGKESYGQLKSIEDNDTSKLQGRIVFCPHSVDISFLKRMAECNIKGLIIPAVNNSDLTEFIGKEIGVALTGNENIPYSIIITEGFGSFTMNSELIDLLNQYEGKNCFLNTFTQIRAGVIRPEIIISLSDI